LGSRTRSHGSVDLPGDISGSPDVGGIAATVRSAVREVLRAQVRVVRGRARDPGGRRV
jgi:hypothetical protein